MKRFAAALLLVAWLVLGWAPPGLGSEADPEAAAVRPIPDGARLVVEMRPQAEVRGSVVLLRDVVGFVAGDRALWQRIEELEVGAAPLPGQSRTLTRPVVLQRLRQARLSPALVEWATPVEMTLVTAAGLAVDEAVVSRAIRQYLASAGPAGETGSLRLESIEMPQDLLVPPGTVEAAVVAAPPVMRPGPAVFAVDVLVDGAPQRRIWVRATLGQAASRIEGGVTPLPSPAPAASSGVASAALAPAGGAPQTSPPGLPVGREGAEVPRGASVTVLVRRGAVTVAVQGTTLEAARVGQRAAVEVAASGAVLQAVLVGPDLAVVEAGPQP